MKWLIKNGISKNRLTAKGYGETQLTNNCSDGIECSEDEHQANRRSEFIILQK
jgi:outer membrane protein OmpA-like peptidoglycan-associated protein